MTYIYKKLNTQSINLNIKKQLKDMGLISNNILGTTYIYKKIEYRLYEFMYKKPTKGCGLDKL